jgi:hypothetical protein
LDRYGELAARVTRVAREVRNVELFERVKAGDLGPQQGERLAMFLDLERLGLAQQYYGSLYVARRREVRKLGYSANEAGVTAMDVDLDRLHAPYKRAVDRGFLKAAASLA